MSDKRSMRAALVGLCLINMLPAIEAEDSWILLGIVALAGMVGLVTWRPDQRRGVSAAVVYAGVVGAIIFLIREMFFPPEGVTVYVLDLAHFMILLCACKFLELRTDRDIGLTAIIAGLVLVIGAFVSGSILFAIAVAIDVTLGVWWLLAFQMRREFEAVSRRAQVSNPAIKPPATFERPPALYRPALLIGMAMCSVATVLFVAVPRGWGRTVLGSIQRVMPTSLTGFSEEVELTGTPLVESDVQVMRVRFSRGGEPIVDDEFRAYMRGTTLEQYHKGRWNRASTRGASPRRVGSKALPEAISEARSLFRPADIIEQEVWLDRTTGGYLFAIYPALGIGSEMLTQVRPSPRDHSITARNAGRGMISYIVESPVKMNEKAARLLNPLYQAEFPPTGFPSVIPERIRELAEQLAVAAGDWEDTSQHERIVAAFLRHLNGREFSYSLDPGERPAKGVDPIEHFLTQTHRGHCEYFASALALMCQAVDIPARLATGYYGGEFNPVGGYYQFRARDAHAWVEVFLPKRGWVIYDPSPASPSQRRGTQLGLLSELKRLAGYLQFEWSTFVVAFDADHRQELVMGFLNWLENLTSGQKGTAISWRTIREFFWGPSFLSGGQRAVYWLFLLLCAAMLIAGLRVLWIVGILARELLPRGRRGVTAPVRVPEARFYDRILLLLARKGHVKAERETPREFAARLKLRHLDLADMPDITELFYAAQYGARMLEADARERVNGFMQRLREEPGFGAR